MVRATRDNEYSDLYFCLPWSHGTLGFLVGLELKIVKVKPYVHMKYIPVKGQTNYCNAIRDLSGANDANREVPDYLEATIYNKVKDNEVEAKRKGSYLKLTGLA